MKNRKGILKVSKDWIEHFKDIHFKDENLPKELFSRVVPIRIEEKFETGELLYFCLSEHFEELKEGEDVPYYEITVSVEHGIFKNIIFKRLPSLYQEMDELRRENQNLKSELESLKLRCEFFDSARINQMELLLEYTTLENGKEVKKVWNKWLYEQERLKNKTTETQLHKPKSIFESWFK